LISARRRKKSPPSAHCADQPELITEEGAVIEEEGCLSIPEYTEKVKRAQKVRVRAQGQDGNFLK